MRRWTAPPWNPDRDSPRRGKRSPPEGIPTRSAVRETYERIAPSFAIARRSAWPEVLAFVDTLAPRSRVLDLGCGSGRHVRALLSRGHAVAGLDFSPSLLRLGRAYAPAELPSVHWVEADASTLPVKSGSFDAVLCIAVLHHLPTRADRLETLREVRRALVPGGRALFSAWALDQPRFRDVAESQRDRSPESRGDVEVPWTMPDGTHIPRFYHLFQDGELEGLIIESGLHGETFFRSGGNWFGRTANHG